MADDTEPQRPGAGLPGTPAVGPPPPALHSLGAIRWDQAPLPPLDPLLAGALLDNITARIGIIGRDRRYLYANREMLEFLGMSAEQVIGRHVAEVLGAELDKRYAPLAQRLFAGEALRIEGWAEYPGRGLRYLQETFVPFAPDGREVVAVAVYGRDHTELKLREQQLAAQLEALQASEALKSAIVDHALAAIVATDAQGRIVEFNPSAELMFGRARDTVLGRPVSEVLMAERFRAAHEAGLLRLARGEAPRVLGKRLELHAVRADGSEFPIEMVLWRSELRGTTYYTASIADMTELRSAAQQIQRQREALRQSEKLGTMGSLLAGVAHELNNPLAIVMGRASLVEEKCEDPALRDDIQRIREAAERCGRIVRTFLNMARSRPSQRGPVSINELVRAAAEMLQYGYRAHGIELGLELAADAPPVNADADQIGQVVLNLLVNAQHALAGAAGERRVVLRTGVEAPRAYREPRVWLRVVDSGPGVPAELHERIFEPFFTTKAEGIGTGLGLAVSRSFAREHGGDLVLEAPRAARGAVFRLSLPISGQAGAAPVPVVMPAAEPAPLARVLVVDDEAERADLMRDMLESAGYDVAVAESGAVALELLATVHFDALVSDLRMPDMDGATLWREVTQRHPTLARRVLFVTGDTLSPAAREFLREAAASALDKPFSKAELLARVAALLG